MHTMNMASGGLMWRRHRCCLCLCRRHTSRWHCMHIAVAGFCTVRRYRSMRVRAGRSHIIDIHVVNTAAAGHRSLAACCCGGCCCLCRRHATGRHTTMHACVSHVNLHVVSRRRWLWRH